MPEEKDQRKFDRIQIPGAQVTYRKRNKFGIFERSSRPMSLLDITKSGLCFMSDKKLQRGEAVCIDISIPGEKELRLYGNIKWINDDSHTNSCLIGAQFSAFGEGRAYNSLKSLDRLRMLHKKYGEAKE